MRIKKRRRKDVVELKIAKRCVAFFTTICIIPLVLVFLIATDSYSRPFKDKSFLQSEGLNDYTNAIFGNSTANVATVERRMAARRQHMRKACKYLELDVPGNDSLHKPNSWEFLINFKYRLVWCNVFKAASTSWMYNFNILAGYTPGFLKKSKTVPLSLAREKYPRPSLKTLRTAFNDSVSFLIVRHPLERLLSGYKDKLQHSLPHTYHRRLGRQIVIRFRKLLNPHGISSSNDRWPTFPEFVEYILESVRKGNALDMHWTPITTFCTPCMYDFDIIAHTETLQEDQQYLIAKAHLMGLVEPQWRNPGNGITSRQVQKYYSQLTRSQILQLYHVYRYDFELFNYTLSGYLELGIPDRDPSALLAAISQKNFPENEKGSSPIVY